MKIILPDDILIKKQLTHCTKCILDSRVFCHRDNDAACLECGECFCAGHIIEHLKEKHFIESSMDYCSERCG